MVALAVQVRTTLLTVVVGLVVVVVEPATTVAPAEEVILAVEGGTLQLGHPAVVVEVTL
jgi:hypothetical protein